MQTSRFVLEFAAAQLFERLARTDRFLSNARRDVAKSSERVLDTLSAHVSSIRKDLIDACGDFANMSDTPDKLDGAAMLLNISTLFNEFERIHERLSYVSRALRNSQLELFVRAVFEDASRRLGRALMVSVVPSDRYEFEEIDVHRALFSTAGTEAPTLFLPKIEFDNPLHWNPLVHEFGHTLVDLAESPPLDDRFATGGDVLRRWFEETYCDLLATRLLGPAYLASLVDFMIATSADRYIETSTPTHPDDRFRVTAVLALVQSDGLAIRYGEITDLAEFCFRLFEARARLERQYLDLQGHRSVAAPDGIVDLRTHVIDNVSTIVPEPLSGVQFEPAVLQPLCERLAAGIPIGCIHRGVDTFEDATAAATELDRFAIKHNAWAAGHTHYKHEEVAAADLEAIDKHLDRMRSAVRERACSIAEILNAAWLYKFNDIYFPFMRKCGSDLTADVIERFATDIFRLDDVIRTSVDVSYMARQMEEHVENATA